MLKGELEWQRQTNEIKKKREKTNAEDIRTERAAILLLISQLWPPSLLTFSMYSIVYLTSTVCTITQLSYTRVGGK